MAGGAKRFKRRFKSLAKDLKEDLDLLASRPRLPNENAQASESNMGISRFGKRDGGTKTKEMNEKGNHRYFSHWKREGGAKTKRKK